MKIRSIVVSLVLSSSLLTMSQNLEKKMALEINFGKTEYNGDWGNGLFNYSQPFYLSGGLSLSTYVNPSFDLGFRANFGDIGYYRGITENFLGQKLAGSVYTHFKFDNGYFLKEESKFAPFLTLGVGVAQYYLGPYRTDQGAGRIVTNNNDFIVPAGFGLKYNISNTVALQYQFIYNFTNSDIHDNTVNIDNAKDGWADHLFGIVISLGATKDTDLDGVSDVKDKCIDTPTGVVVDAMGCPVDSDNDGIADYLDKCPLTPKNVKVDDYGCPLDGDGDGVADYLDTCPNTPALVKVDNTGCPLDSDGDGIIDFIDKCPDTPKNIKVEASGCPVDSDGDGIGDYMDDCPNTPKNVAVDAKGCPVDSDGDGVADYIDKCLDTPKDVAVNAVGCPLDKDGDGVPDYLDKCPEVKGLANNKGCPEIKEETKKIFAQALLGIQFESGKDVIKPSSFPILNKVVSVMKNNPSYNLEINGHTDNVGGEASNLELSTKRAEAVKLYLYLNGVELTRLTSAGFGQSMPVAPNTTAAGKAKNRRVEFKVNF